MKKLSRKERKEIYLDAIDLMVDIKYQFPCICGVIALVQGYGLTDYEQTNENKFPELFMFEPKYNEKQGDCKRHDNWLDYNEDTHKIRIDILLLCAAMTDNP